MNLSSSSRAQVQMVSTSLRCTIELASKIDGVILRAYSELTRNVAIQLVLLSQLGEELIRMMHRMYQNFNDMKKVVLICLAK
jgi:hypothetical protein